MYQAYTFLFGESTFLVENTHSLQFFLQIVEIIQFLVDFRYFSFFLEPDILRNIELLSQEAALVDGLFYAPHEVERPQSLVRWHLHLLFVLELGVELQV